MGEILGLGLSHGPHGAHQDHTMANGLRRTLASPSTPQELKDPRAWPAPMRAEWSDDEGRRAAHAHRDRLAAGYRRLRESLDSFNPDLVLIWGDDQYENVHEDLVPAFCVYLADGYECTPWARSGHRGSSLDPADNIWGEGADWVLKVQGHRAAAKELAIALLGEGFDIAYAYQQLHSPFGHAFWRTVAYLDYDRRGFPYPVVPFHVNCYGRRFTGGRSGEEFDPPSPTPQRCFDLGAAVARFFQGSPYRVALIGSSSWSHAALTMKHHRLWPDVEADRARFEELKAGDYKAWRAIPLSQIEESGQHELLNWVCLAGAMDALGMRPAYAEFVETWVFNSCKTVAIFE